MQIVDIQANGVFEIMNLLGHHGGPKQRWGAVIPHGIHDSGAGRTAGGRLGNGLMHVLHDAWRVVMRLELSEGFKGDFGSAGLNDRILLAEGGGGGYIHIARTGAALATGKCIMGFLLIKNFPRVRVL